MSGEESSSAEDELYSPFGRLEILNEDIFFAGVEGLRPRLLPNTVAEWGSTVF